MCSFFFFKQKTAYEMRISDWSSDVCSSDLPAGAVRGQQLADGAAGGMSQTVTDIRTSFNGGEVSRRLEGRVDTAIYQAALAEMESFITTRSEEHTSELQSLLRNPYAVYCLKKKIS